MVNIKLGILAIKGGSEKHFRVCEENIIEAWVQHGRLRVGEEEIGIEQSDDPMQAVMRENYRVDSRLW